MGASGSSGNLRYDKNEVLKATSSGFVYRGTFAGSEVAVKMIQRFRIRYVSREWEILPTLAHPGLLQILHINMKKSISYLAYEMFDASLENYCDGNYTGEMPDPIQALIQLTSGLDYLHSKWLIHGEIRPQNVVITQRKPVRVKWIDYGLSVAFNRSSSFYTDGICGSLGWMAPEILTQYYEATLRKNVLFAIKFTPESDIFAAGCVFFFFLTRGIHPFGTEKSIVGNIKDGNPINKSRLKATHRAHGVIEKMMEKDPDKRVTLNEVTRELSCVETMPILKHDSLQDRKSEKKAMETTITKINEEVDETDGKIGMSSKGSRQDKSQSTQYNNRSDIFKVSEKNRNTLRLLIGIPTKPSKFNIQINRNGINNIPEDKIIRQNNIQKSCQASKHIRLIFCKQTKAVQIKYIPGGRVDVQEKTPAV